MTAPLHGPDDHLARRVVDHIVHRIAGGAPLGRAPGTADVALDFIAAGIDGIPRQGRGVDAAWEAFLGAVDANTVGLDSDRFLAFVPMAPSTAAVWMDAVVGASSYSAESWLEAAGAVAAENQVLDWLADLAGLPAGAGGCFMSGGSIGNLSALAVARESAAGRRGAAVADTAHASVANSLRLLGLDPVVVPTEGRFTGEALRAHLASVGRDGSDVGVVVASGGSTNAGIVDDLTSLADEADRLGAWLHVDCAYGGAALLVDDRRPLFAGLERCDSFIIDPHKWLFATGGSCALLYRRPDLARAVHAQHGPYIDVLHADADGGGNGASGTNPSDLGFQLTRRASGLPLWFALQAHGADAHAAAVARGIEVARYAARRLAEVDGVEVIAEPDLSVVLFRRAGWAATDWGRWAQRLLVDGVAFVAPTTWRGEAVGRLIVLHPGTSEALIDEVVDTVR